MAVLSSIRPSSSPLLLNLSTSSRPIAMLLRLLALAVCALFASTAAALPSFPVRYTLEHRLDEPASSSWSTRGHVTLLNSSSATFEQVQRASDLLGDDKQNGADGRYLLRLVGEDGQGQQVVATKKVGLAMAPAYMQPH